MIKVIIATRQSCYQIEISPEFGSFSGAFLGTFDKNKKVPRYLKKNRELFGSYFGCFWQICRNSVLFWELFQRFCIIWKLFGALFDQFWNITEFSVLFSVLFPEKLRIRENSRISGAGNRSATRKSMPQFQGPIFWKLGIWAKFPEQTLKNKNATLIHALIGSIFCNKNILCDDSFKYKKYR